MLALVVPSLLTRLLQACSRLVTCKLDELNSLVTSLFQQLVIGLQSTTCQQVVSHKLGTTALLQTCWQAWTLQACCEHNLLTSCAFLRVYLSNTFSLQASYAVYGVMLHRVITSHKVQQEDTLGKVKATARASIIIMPVLGFTWTFAILDFFFDEVVFKYLFAIFNSLQGLFIFLFHCVMNQQVCVHRIETRTLSRQMVFNTKARSCRGNNASFLSVHFKVRSVYLQVHQAMFKKKPERKSILDRVKTQEMREYCFLLSCLSEWWDSVYCRWGMVFNI